MDGRNRIEHLVKAAARDSSSGGPRLELIRALSTGELFYAATEVMVDGRAMMSTRLRRLEDGSNAMLVYTSKKHPDLPQRFAGAQWSTLVNIAQSVGSDWIVIIGRDNDTVPITRQQLAIISGAIPEAEIGYSQQTARTADALETAISDAVKANGTDRYELALTLLRGREVYAHLIDDVSSRGRTSLLTSAAGGIDGWILIYTTRRRSGIKYGGLAWEDLVDMVKQDAGIPGIRVVNEVDDWIILGRDVI